MKKKLLFVSMAASMLLFACKKDQTSSPAQKTVPVTFNVANGFTISTSTLAAAGSAVKPHSLAADIPVSTKYLTALFYDNNSNLLQRVDQTRSSTTNFGVFKVNLTPGTQVFAFFIATDDSTFTIALSKVHAQSLKHMPQGYPTIAYTNSFLGVPTSNIFSSFRNFTVGSTASTQSLSMPRVVSQLNLVTLDLADSQTYYNYEETYPLNAFDLLLGTGEHTNNYTLVSQTLTPVAGTENNTFTYNLWPGTGNSHLMAGQVTKTLFAKTDTVKINTRYTISGYYYNARPDNTTITTDTTWSKTIIKSVAVKYGKIALK